MCLCVYTPLSLSIGALGAFVLSCTFLLQLKCKLCFPFALQSAIHSPSLSCLLFCHELFCFKSLITHYLCNYFITKSSHVLFCILFKISLTKQVFLKSFFVLKCFNSHYRYYLREKSTIISTVFWKKNYIRKIGNIVKDF